ncbi:MAG: hypothetical protein COA67_07350 [Lutibacter sp.]|nr:MAG: hypothetical protein COA67_07350 [Lutibacter sp.]
MMKIKIKQSSKAESEYLLTGSLIIAFILFITYALYFYKYFPDTKKIETIFFVFESKEYESVYVFMWVFLSKLVPLLLLLLWFTTCKHWWYYSIAIPIAVYVFQLISVINDDIKFADDYEFIYSLPFTIIILGFLYYIRNRISTYLKAVDLKTQVDEVIDKGIKKREEYLKEKGYD